MLWMSGLVGAEERTFFILSELILTVVWVWMFSIDETCRNTLTHET